MEKISIAIYDQYITPKKCAEILNCHVTTILNSIKNGELKCIKLGPTKGLRIHIDEFNKFLEKKQYSPEIK